MSEFEKYPTEIVNRYVASSDQAEALLRDLIDEHTESLYQVVQVFIRGDADEIRALPDLMIQLAATLAAKHMSDALLSLVQQEKLT